jgi:hypothetical protein
MDSTKAFVDSFLSVADVLGEDSKVDSSNVVTLTMSEMPDVEVRPWEVDA